MKVKVLIPRFMSGQVEGAIIEMFNIEDEPNIFMLFGGKYEKVEDD